MTTEEALIILIIGCILLFLTLSYFIIQSIYYYHKIDKLEERIKYLEND